MLDMLILSGGVPWDVAMQWSPLRRFAAVVAKGELAGRRFNWNTLKWEE